MPRARAQEARTLACAHAAPTVRMRTVAPGPQGSPAPARSPGYWHRMSPAAHERAEDRSQVAEIAAILLPALNKARDAANTIKCVAELRQLGTMVEMYAGDNRGYIPIAKYNKTAAQPPATEQ